MRRRELQYATRQLVPKIQQGKPTRHRVLLNSLFQRIVFLEGEQVREKMMI